MSRSFRFQIRRTQKEWEDLASAINSKHKGKSINSFLFSELNKIFGKTDPAMVCTDETDAANDRIRKCFEIIIPEDMHKSILCAAKSKGVDPGRLVSDMIITPHLPK